MGKFIKKLLQAMGLAKSKAGIVVIGLDNSGKSTLLQYLKPDKVKSESMDIAPTVGFAIEGFSKENLNFTCFDMSGDSKYRSLWEQYYADVQAIIFVLDSTDKIRMCVAKDELETLLEHSDIKDRNIPILFFANKMDRPGALSPVDCMGQLSLDAITDKPWHITASNALTGNGIDEGISWLAETVSKYMDSGK